MTAIASHRLDILLISRCPPYPLHLGDRLIPYHIVRQLVRRGHTVDMLAFYQQPEDLADVPYYERYFRHVQLIREPVRRPARLLRRAWNASKRFPTRKSQSWAPEMWEAIEERLQHHNYDVVHMFGGVHVYEFRELTRRYPALIVPYESYTLFLERALEQAGNQVERLAVQAQLRMARSYESWMFEGYQRTVVVSDKDAEKLHELVPELPVTVIPNGVDVEKFAPTGHDSEAPIVIFTGNYAYGPNLDAALRLVNDIFPAVKRAVPAAELHIVGNAPPPELRRLKRPGVQITGRVPDLRPYLESAAVYVSPLRLGAGIKNKILEAMAMQTAVVATSLSCDGIAVQDRHDVLIADRDADLIKATVHLLKHPDQRQQMAVNGRALIERQYTWQRVAESYETLFRTIMAERSGRPYAGR